jgi:hypothetical protein
MNCSKQFLFGEVKGKAIELKTKGWVDSMWSAGSERPLEGSTLPSR